MYLAMVSSMVIMISMLPLGVPHDVNLPELDAQVEEVAGGLRA